MTAEAEPKRHRPRVPREEVRVYGGTIHAIAQIREAKGQTKTEVVRDAIARYQADLIDEGTLKP